MQHRSILRLVVPAIATAAIATACSRPATVTNARMMNTSPGEVALSNGLWFDSSAGIWMDQNGALWLGPSRAAYDIQRADVQAMTNANILAHIMTADSLEIGMSQVGVDRAQNAAVRTFAERMVREHSAHMRQGEQLASTTGLTLSPAPSDTVDKLAAGRVMNRVATAYDSHTFDRQFMRAEVLMHQHLLHELLLMQPQATGATRQLIDQTIPVVENHLAAAQSVWRQVGGGTNANP